MKKAKMKIFKTLPSMPFGENMALINTISGHYAIPFTHSTQFINDIDRESLITVTLMITKKSNLHTLHLTNSST